MHAIKFSQYTCLQNICKMFLKLVLHKNFGLLWINSILVLQFVMFYCLIVLWSGSNVISFWFDVGWGTILRWRLVKAKKQLSFHGWGRFVALLFLCSIYCGPIAWQSWNCSGWKKVCPMHVLFNAWFESILVHGRMWNNNFLCLT